MANKELTVWGIHAGRTGDAYNLFMKKNVVALGWPEVGDLKPIQDRDE
jgi:restriction system protein